MRIAQFSYEYPPQSWGGLGTYLEGLVEHLRSEGDEVDLIFLADKLLATSHISLPFYKDEAIQVYGPNELESAGVRCDYDVIVCQDWPGVVASQALWKRAIPLIYTCHLPLAWDVGEVPDIPCQFSAELEFSGISFADAILTVSGAVANHLKNEFPYAIDRLSVIHNGTDVCFFNNDRPSRQEGPPTLLFFGRFEQQKGFDLVPAIFHAAKMLVPDLILHLMGDGHQRRSVEAEFKRRNIATSVRWERFGDRNDVFAALAGTDVVLMPSRFEPFGLAATESMAMQVPVVAAASGGLCEIISHNEDGILVDIEDIECFGQEIAHLICDRKRARRIGTAGRKKVMEHFSQQACVRRTRAFYAHVANASKPPARGTI